jgi:hypothetical protein
MSGSRNLFLSKESYVQFLLKTKTGSDYKILFRGYLTFFAASLSPM